MAQKTAWAGNTATETDINLYLMHEGGAWTSWTPVVTQSATPTTTNNRSRWARASRLIHVSFSLTFGATPGTAANAIIMTLPVTAATSGQFVCSSGELFDSSASLKYPFQVYLESSTTVSFRNYSGGAASDNRLGVLTFTAALANADTMNGSFFYESAT